MDYNEESFVKVFRRRTVSLALVGWAARAVLVELRCKCDSFGVIDTAGEDPAEAVTVLLGDIPLDVVRDSLGKLAYRGEIKIGRTQILVVEHQQIQEARKSPVTRSKEYRDRKRAEAFASVQVPIFDEWTLGKESDQRDATVTKSDEPSRNVTHRHENTQIHHDQIRSDQITPPNPLAPTPAPQSHPTPDPKEQSEAIIADPNPRQAKRLEDLPIGELSKKVLENPYNATFLDLANHPEIVEIHAAWAKSVGLAVRKIGCYQRDKGLQAIIEAYALGYSTTDLLGVCAAAKEDDWLCGKQRDGRKKGIECMTPAKLGELLDISKATAERARKRSEREASERKRQAEEERRNAEIKAAPRPVINLRTLVPGIPSKYAPPASNGRRISADEIDAALNQRSEGGQNA
jgi:hypothetical protein